MSLHVDNFLSPYLCGYRKGISTQQALLSLIGKWKNILDKKGYGGAVLMVLSKAFDTLNHNLLMAKLHAYVFSTESLKLIKSYLTNRLQRTKVNTNSSRWSELLIGVPQGSFLGPLLFNIYTNYLFHITEMTNVCNYAYATTKVANFHACDSDLESLIQGLEHDSMLATEWFESTYMKLNNDKYHLLLSGYKHEVMWANIGQSQIWESKEQRLLGVITDRDMKFDEYILIQCKKVGRKLCALGRVCKYLNLERRMSLMKAFIEFQFANCPLVWMFCSRGSNNRINHLHERALRIDDHSSTFEDLLVKDNSVSIYYRNIRLLATEL